MVKLKNHKKIFLVAGARPNFMKIAPLIRQLQKYKNFFETKIIHTGQHYDYELNKVFFHDLEIPQPDYFLGVGSGTHAYQTAKIMIKFENVCMNEKPDLVIVVGDVNSTLAASLVSAKLYTRVAHIEAGLRSFDRTMPEEINRIVTDSLSEYLFTTCQEAGQNLKREGIAKEKIFFVGNVMIDTLRSLKAKAANQKALKEFDLQAKKFALLTLHRPSNVDNKDSLKRILKALKEVSKSIAVIFPAHPRTSKQIMTFGFQNYFKNYNIRLIKPLGYLAFLNLMINSKFVLTDSGGIQEETTALNIPCLTLRKNTERPITISSGTNIIVGNDEKRIIHESKRVINGSYKKGHLPLLWDGKSAQRIVNILVKRLITDVR